ncbi:hypothetical protein BGX26_000879 [Mortierella sp. AD094]|nr:hypothetical protein BGX26_000879 [Mortierella sp. AD094]
MSLSAFSAKLFPTMRSQAMTRFAAPTTSSFARYYSSKRFTREHEWVQVKDGVATVGITDHAQAALGEIVYVEAAELKEIEAGDTIGSVESVKAASDVYAPLTGKVVEVNEALSQSPELINESAETEGWLCKIQLANEEDFNGLLSEKEYKAFVEEGH